MANELVAVNDNFGDAKVGINTSAPVRARVVIILDQITFDLRRQNSVIIHLNSDNIVLHNVIADLVAAVITETAGVRVDAGDRARIGQRRSLDREAIQDNVVR